MEPTKCTHSDIVITPDHLDFETEEGSSFNPPTQDLFLKKERPGLSAPWHAEVITHPQDWLKLGATSGSVPKRVRVYCKSMGMPAGEWTGEIKIISSVKVTPSVIPVKVKVRGEVRKKFRINCGSKYFELKYGDAHPVIEIEKELDFHGSSSPQAFLYLGRVLAEGKRELQYGKTYYGYIEGSGEFVHESELTTLLLEIY